MSSHSLLSKLASFSETDEDAPQPVFLALCQELADAFNRRARLCANATPERPLRAYLLVDSWSGGELATALTEHWPEQLAGLTAVPSWAFKGQPTDAPHLMPLPAAVLPDGPTDSLAEAVAMGRLACLLERAWRLALRRQVPQSLCAVVFTAASAATIAQHLAALSVQRIPGTPGEFLFRLQDPRVMQRIWPGLTTEQRSLWLEPFTDWWSLAQPWGPWDQAQLKDAAAANGTPLLSAAPAWFKVQAEEQQQDLPWMLGRLFTAHQLAHVNAMPLANRIWERFVAQDVAGGDQPDGALMQRLIERAEALGLSDRNLEDFVWCSCRYREEQASIDWNAPRWAQTLAGTLETLQSTPDTRFVSAFDSYLTAGDRARALRHPL